MNVWSVLCSTPKYQRATYIIVHNRVIYIIRQKKRFTHTHTPVYICTALHIDFIIIQSVYYRRGRFQFRSRFLFLLFDFSLSLSISSWLHSIHFCRVHLHSNWPVLMRCMPNVLLISNSVFKSFSRSYYLRMEVHVNAQTNRTGRENKNRNKNSTQIRRRQGESDLTLNQLHGDSLFVCVY